MRTNLLSFAERPAHTRLEAGLLAPRSALAATMLYHGLDKLRDPDKTKAGFAAMGIRPAGFWSRATAVAETGAGLLTALGILVRPAAVAVLVTQAVAIAKVHGPKGFAVQKGGFEFNLALMAIAGALLIGGPGRFSASRLATRRLAKPTAWPFRRARRASLVARLLHLVG
jgi:putative oxidoreductase